MLDMWSQALLLVGAGVVLFGIWKAARPRWDIHIVVCEGTVEFRRGVALARRAEVESFFLRDLKLPSTTEVFARREAAGRLVTRFSGELDPGTRQRIRNFLMTTV